MLTVPKAPISAGRAADTTVRYQNPGPEMAQLGQEMFQMGALLENDRLDRQMSRLQVGMTRDLGTLRQQVEAMGDPDVAGAAWDQGLTELRNSYMTGVDENGRPRVDEKNAENFNLAFDDLSSRHGLAIGGRTMALRQSERAATFMDYERTAAIEAARTDPDTRAQIYATYDSEADKMVANGIWSPEQGATNKMAFREETQNTGAIELVTADPARFLELNAAGAYDFLPPERAASYAVQAQGRLDAMTAAEARQAEAARKERAAKIDTRLDQIIDIVGDDRVAVDEAWLNSAEVKASPKYAETMAAIALRDEQPGIATMTPAELDAAVAAEAARPVGQPFQTERLKVLTAARDKAREGYSTDPIAYARTAGLPVPDLPELNAEDPAAFVEGVAARVTFGRELQQDGYTNAPAIFDQDEAASVKAALTVEQDPADRARLAGALVASVRQRGGSPSQLANVFDDPVLSHVGGFIAAGGNAGLATEILRGEQVMAQGNVVMPPVADRMAPVFDQIGVLFADIPGGEAQQATVTAAADALYAVRQRRIDPTGDIDEDLYSQVLHEVMGGTGAFGSSDARGGVAEINGRLTMLGRGVSAEDVEVTVDAIERDLTPAPLLRARANAVDRTPSRAAEVLTKAGRTGGVPAINGVPLTADDWDGASFVAVGPDRYAIMLDVADGKQASDSTDPETPFIFSMKDLLRGYGR